MAETLQFIKDIKPELREKLIYREHINQKYTAKKAQGWNEVHKSIKSAPYCERKQQIANIFFCPNCMHRAGIYRCNLCHRKGKCHYLEYPGFDNNDYDPCFIRIYPYEMSWCDRLREIYANYELEIDPIAYKYARRARHIRKNKIAFTRTSRKNSKRIRQNEAKTAQKVGLERS